MLAFHDPTSGTRCRGAVHTDTVSPTFMIDGMVQADISSGDAVADWASRLLKS